MITPDRIIITQDIQRMIPHYLSAMLQLSLIKYIELYITKKISSVITDKDTGECKYTPVT